MTIDSGSWNTGNVQAGLWEWFCKLPLEERMQALAVDDPLWIRLYLKLFKHELKTRRREQQAQDGAGGASSGSYMVKRDKVNYMYGRLLRQQQQQQASSSAAAAAASPTPAASSSSSAGGLVLTSFLGGLATGASTKRHSSSSSSSSSSWPPAVTPAPAPAPAVAPGAGAEPDELEDSVGDESLSSSSVPPASSSSSLGAAAVAAGSEEDEEELAMEMEEALAADGEDGAGALAAYAGGEEGNVEDAGEAQPRQAEEQASTGPGDGEEAAEAAARRAGEVLQRCLRLCSLGGPLDTLTLQAGALEDPKALRRLLHAATKGAFLSRAVPASSAKQLGQPPAASTLTTSATGGIKVTLPEAPWLQERAAADVPLRELLANRLELSLWSAYWRRVHRCPPPPVRAGGTTMRGVRESAGRLLAFADKLGPGKQAALFDGLRLAQRALQQQQHQAATTTQPPIPPPPPSHSQAVAARMMERLLFVPVHWAYRDEGAAVRAVLERVQRACADCVASELLADEGDELGGGGGGANGGGKGKKVKKKKRKQQQQRQQQEQKEEEAVEGASESVADDRDGEGIVAVSIPINDGSSSSAPVAAVTVAAPSEGAGGLQQARAMEAEDEDDDAWEQVGRKGVPIRRPKTRMVPSPTPAAPMENGEGKKEGEGGSSSKAEENNVAPPAPAAPRITQPGSEGETGRAERPEERRPPIQESQPEQQPQVQVVAAAAVAEAVGGQAKEGGQPQQQEEPAAAGAQGQEVKQEQQQIPSQAPPSAPTVAVVGAVGAALSPSAPSSSQPPIGGGVGAETEVAVGVQDGAGKQPLLEQGEQAGTSKKKKKKNAMRPQTKARRKMRAAVQYAVETVLARVDAAIDRLEGVEPAAAAGEVKAARRRAEEAVDGDRVVSGAAGAGARAGHAAAGAKASGATHSPRLYPQQQPQRVARGGGGGGAVGTPSPRIGPKNGGSGGPPPPPGGFSLNGGGGGSRGQQPPHHVYHHHHHHHHHQYGANGGGIGGPPHGTVVEERRGGGGGSGAGQHHVHHHHHHHYHRGRALLAPSAPASAPMLSSSSMAGGGAHPGGRVGNGLKGGGGGSQHYPQPAMPPPPPPPPMQHLQHGYYVPGPAAGGGGRQHHHHYHHSEQPTAEAYRRMEEQQQEFLRDAEAMRALLSRNVQAFLRRREAAMRAHRRQRQKVVDRVTSIITGLWAPSARVELYGSCFTGLDLVSSDVDLVVCGLPPHVPTTAPSTLSASPPLGPCSLARRPSDDSSSGTGTVGTGVTGGNGSAALDADAHSLSSPEGGGSVGSRGSRGATTAATSDSATPSTSTLVNGSCSSEGGTSPQPRSPALSSRASPSSSAPASRASSAASSPRLEPSAAGLLSSPAGPTGRHPPSLPQLHHHHPHMVTHSHAEQVRYLRQLAAALEGQPWIVSMKTIESAFVPVIKLVADPSALAGEEEEEDKGGATAAAAAAVVPIDISLEGPQHGGIASSLLIRDLTRPGAPYAHAVPLTLVLKTLMSQRGMNQPWCGGLSSYALMLMVIAVLQHFEGPEQAQANVLAVHAAVAAIQRKMLTGGGVGDVGPGNGNGGKQQQMDYGKALRTGNGSPVNAPTSPAELSYRLWTQFSANNGASASSSAQQQHPQQQGAAAAAGEPLSPGFLLTYFLEYYGRVFSPAAEGIAVDQGFGLTFPLPEYWAATGVGAADPLTILDPLDRHVNVARCCFRVGEIQWMFAQCLLTLESQGMALARRRVAVGAGVGQGLRIEESDQDGQGKGKGRMKGKADGGGGGGGGQPQQPQQQQPGQEAEADVLGLVLSY